MGNFVLKSLRVKNFGPFADEVSFTTVVDRSKKEFLENTFCVDDDTYNKISYIYGANGSGKTNFCKAILQIRNLINLSPLLATNNPQFLELRPVKLGTEEIDKYFLFDDEGKEKPSEYAIEIILDGITYNYSFAIHHGVILSEKLTKKRRRTETIMNRTSPDFRSIELKSELSSFSANISVVKEQALCLSMANFLNNSLATKLVAAINDIDVVNMTHLNGLRNINPKNFNEDIRQKCLSILKLAEPTMEDLDVQFSEEEVVDTRKVPMMADDIEGRAVVIKNVRVDVNSVHSVYHNDELIDQIKLPFLKHESNGTIKILGILPVIFHALENGSPLVIDELENGLHPSIVNAIVDFFNSEEHNPLNAQLICTTHSMPLVEDHVRRDQVWIISKDNRGKSSIQRISDFPKTRTTDNIVEKYLKNAFGNVPKFS